MKGKVMEEMKKTFRPEFLNRLDETIVSMPLRAGRSSKSSSDDRKGQ